MTEEEALAAVTAGLVSRESLPVKLRMGDGFDAELFDRTRAALRFLAERYRDRDHVPKALAFAMVDLTGTLMAADYPPELWERVQSATDELVALAYEIFEVPTPDAEP